MASLAQRIFDPYAPLPTTRDGMPIFYEDEEEGELGETTLHSDACAILHICLKVHLASRLGFRVFTNMNCYYLEGPPHTTTGSLPYVSPDIMIVKPRRDLGERVESYTIGHDGPAPILVAEVLSPRSIQQRDLCEKLTIYARLGVAEYLLSGTADWGLSERLLLKRLGRNGSWKDHQDEDGGITSRLRFRVLIDSDGRLRLQDLMTGKPYPRPDEANHLQHTLEHILQLEAEVKRLREAARKKQGRGKK